MLEKYLNEIIESYLKPMLAQDQSFEEFKRQLEEQCYDNAYDMLATSIKEKFTIDEFQEIVNPKALSTQPTEYYEGPTIYKDIALQFADYLVQNKYEDAYNLLSLKLKEEYSPEKLKENYTKMISYFHTDKITVYKEFVIAEGDAGDKNNIYVPIEEDGNQEAIFVNVDYENGLLSIKSLDWGRP